MNARDGSSLLDLDMRPSGGAAGDRPSKSSPRRSDWPVDELRILKAIYPRTGAAGVLKRLPHRSKASIYSKAHELGLKVSNRAEYTSRTKLSLVEISAGLGVQMDTVLVWCKQRGLPARSQNKEWYVTRAALRRWLSEHPKSINLAKVDQEWFIALALAP